MKSFEVQKTTFLAFCAVANSKAVIFYGTVRRYSKNGTFAIHCGARNPSDNDGSKKELEQYNTRHVIFVLLFASFLSFFITWAGTCLHGRCMFFPLLNTLFRKNACEEWVFLKLTNIFSLEVEPPSASLFILKAFFGIKFN